MFALFPLPDSPAPAVFGSPPGALSEAGAACLSMADAVTGDAAGEEVAVRSVPEASPSAFALEGLTWSASPAGEADWTGSVVFDFEGAGDAWLTRTVAGRLGSALRLSWLGVAAACFDACRRAAMAGFDACTRRAERCAFPWGPVRASDAFRWWPEEWWPEDDGADAVCRVTAPALGGTAVAGAAATTVSSAD